VPEGSGAAADGHAAAPSAGGDSGPDAEQLKREKREDRRAQENAANQRATLRQQRLEASLEHGRALLRSLAGPVIKELTNTLASYAADPTRAGQHHAALPLLEEFGQAERSAVLALRVLLNRITSGDPFSTLAGLIGATLERELVGLQLAAARPTTFRQMKRRHPKRSALVRPAMIEALAPNATTWTRKEQHEVGGLLLLVIERSTGLVEIRKETVGAKVVRMVRPTAETLAVCRSIPASEWPTPRGPMACPPRPWATVTGGGYLTGEEGLIRHRSGDDATSDYFARTVERQTLEVVNHLQRQPLQIDGEMVDTVRQAWEQGGCGLFKVQRAGPRIPDRPVDDAPRGEWDGWKRDAAISHDDQRRNMGRRLRIERGIQALEDVAGRPAWFPYELDFRGRVYTSNKTATHQGQDFEKASVEFARGQALDHDGFEWLLKAAAGHYGLGRATWEERRRWGMENMNMLLAVAENPLGLADQLAQASDPWQLLQVARAIAAWLKDPGQPIGCPVRLDQTTSGCGIIAGLLRDQWLAGQTNLTGTQPMDLYATIAEKVEAMVKRHLNSEDRRQHLRAQLWLQVGINRKLMKGPVLALPYGGRIQGTIDHLCRHLEDKLGWIGPFDYDKKVAGPASWLAQIIHKTLEEELPAAMAFRRWCLDLGAAVIKQQHPIEWRSPSGFPVRLGQRTPTTETIKTELFGLARMQMSLERTPPDGELSLRRTNAALAANVTHSFDAAFCHGIISTTAAVGEQLLTNHDCYAVRAGSVGWLQTQLLHELRETFKTDWLGVMLKEIEASTGITELPPPPIVGTLDVGAIGENLYAFS
jgi:DNA-directed RNA polymerase